MSENRKAQDPERFGRFETEGVIGRGGMGVVYRAKDPVIGRSVAIKALRTEPEATGRPQEEMQSRFELEFRSAGTLSHPHIVTIYDVGQQEDTTFIAMELIEGKSLEQLLREGEVLSFEQICEIAEGLCSGLDYAHRAGIVHRDVKPANILITRDGRAKITDFGVAKVMRSSNLTQTGTVVGTPAFMAPEQVLGKTVSGATDQFAAAGIIYQLLTGTLPFGSEEPAAILYRIVHGDPKPPTDLNDQLPAAVDAALMRGLSKEPTERYPTCSDLAHAVRAALCAPASAAESRSEANDQSGVRSVTLSTPEVVGSGTYDGAVSWWQRQPNGPRYGLMVLGALLFAGLGFASVAAWMNREAWFGPDGELPFLSGGEATVAPVSDVEAEPEPPPPVHFNVETTPSGATVLLDGEPLEGTTPLVVELEAGASAELEFRKEGFDPETREIVASPDGDHRVQVELRAEIVPGRIAVRGPFEAQLLVRGRRSDGRGVAPGSVPIELRAPALYYREERTVRVREGETTNVQLPAVVTVRIIGIGNGRFSIDGGDLMEGPLDVRLTEGSTHRFHFEWADGVTRDRTIEIAPDLGQIIGSPNEIVTR